MKVIRRLCAVLVGFVFYIAGLLKLMDPVGSSLIVGEYLKFLHIGFLGFGARAIAVVLALVETGLGVALLTGVFRKITALLTGIIVGFFTVITFILWLANPAMDCGCFGEAVHLTHLQSLLKNIALCALCAVAFLPVSKLGQPRKPKYAGFLIAEVSTIVFCLYSLAALPLKDYTPMNSGAELGIQGEAGLEDLPTLSFFNEEGEYCDSLAVTSDVMIVSLYNPSSFRKWDKLQEFVSDAQEAGFRTLVLASDYTPADSYFADRRALMTLNRSNGGVTYVSDGHIVTKWPAISRPSAEKLAGIAQTDPDQILSDSLSKSKLSFQGYLLYVFAVMLLL